MVRRYVIDADNMFVMAVPRREIRHDIGPGFHPACIEKDVFPIGIYGHVKDVHLNEVLEEVGAERQIRDQAAILVCDFRDYGDVVNFRKK